MGDLQLALARMEASFEERMTASMIASEARMTASLEAAALRAAGTAIDTMFPRRFWTNSLRLRPLEGLPTPVLMV